VRQVALPAVAPILWLLCSTLPGGDSAAVPRLVMVQKFFEELKAKVGK
jgi:hypothetical protein